MFATTPFHKVQVNSSAICMLPQMVASFSRAETDMRLVYHTLSLGDLFQTWK